MAEIYSFWSFWWKASAKAGNRAWGHYGNIALIAGILQTLFLLQFVSKFLPGVDMNLWLSFTPLFLWIIIFFIQLARAAYKIYVRAAKSGNDQEVEHFSIGGKPIRIALFLLIFVTIVVLTMCIQVNQESLITEQQKIVTQLKGQVEDLKKPKTIPASGISIQVGNMSLAKSADPSDKTMGIIVFASVVNRGPETTAQFGQGTIQLSSGDIVHGQLTRLPSGVPGGYTFVDNDIIIPIPFSDIRAGDDFVVPSVSLLRNLFFPQSGCRLVPKLKASCAIENGQTRYDVFGVLDNLGGATAFDTLVITHCSPNVGTTRGITNWDTDPSGDPRYKSTKTPIHPGTSRPFFAMVFSPQYNPQGYANGLEFKIQVFARDAEPLEWLISFTEAEVKTGCEKGGRYRTLLFPL